MNGELLKSKRNHEIIQGVFNNLLCKYSKPKKLLIDFFKNIDSFIRFLLIIFNEIINYRMIRKI